MACHGTDEDVMRVFVPEGRSVQDLFAVAASSGIQLRHVRPSVPTLEDVFARAVGEE
jgi:ABC-2 type transport system ATP-binding protein